MWLRFLFIVVIKKKNMLRKATEGRKGLLYITGQGSSPSRCGSHRQELVLGGHVEPTVNKQRTMTAQYLWLRSLSLLLQSRIVARGPYHPLTVGEEDIAVGKEDVVERDRS